MVLFYQTDFFSVYSEDSELHNGTSIASEFRYVCHHSGDRHDRVPTSGKVREFYKSGSLGNIPGKKCTIISERVAPLFGKHAENREKSGERQRILKGNWCSKSSVQFPLPDSPFYYAYLL